MRVTQKTMYSSMLNDMNRTLSAYMESNMQGATQKKVNRPSDDPAGMARILTYRGTIERTSQYESNADTALGWLNLADATLNNVSTTIIRIKSLAEQASTDTYGPEQRASIGNEIRQLMGSLLNLSNTEFEGKHIFSGQKYNTSAFQEGLAVTNINLDGAAPNPPMQVTGSLKQTAMVRFPDPDVPPAGNPITIPPTAPDTVTYEYSLDGGKNWETGVMNPPAAPNVNGYFDVGGSRITLPSPATTTVKPYKANEEQSETNGTTMYIRPTAIYQGNDNNSAVRVDAYGPQQMPTVGTSVTGTLSSDVVVRFNETVTPTPNGVFSYSYSTDGGQNWVEGSAQFLNDGAGGNSARLVIPGGFLDVDAPAGTAPIPEGGQFIVRPQRTELQFEISQGEFMTVNNVGKDVFGGLFTTNGDPNLQAMFGEGDGRNLFETVGRLIGFCETNDQNGIARTLVELDSAHKSVLTYQAGVGGKENRIEVTQEMLDSNKFDQVSRMSAIEDVNLSDLMIRFTQQQLAYQTVLKSSSMIMQLNMTKFV